MPNEIELKLRIAQADAAKLGQHPALREHLVGKPVTRRLVSIYYDTPDLRLLESEISLRVRRMSGKWFQAVKGAGHALAGLHQRMEWEDIIAKGEPDFSKITEPRLAALFADPGLRNALRPVFTTDVRRTEWQLAFEDGSAIEVALDLGQLLPGVTAKPQQSEPIKEVEIELKHGHASHVFALALALQADIPLHIENISKAQRGYAYYVPPRPAGDKARIIALPPGTPSAEAFQAIAGACLQQMQTSQDVLLVAQQMSAEPMRAAMQQLAFALKAFGRKGMNKELAWVRKALDTVQDWERFLHDILPVFASASSGLPDILYQRAVASQKRAWTRLLQILKSQRYQRLLLNMGACLAAAVPPAEKKARPKIKSYLRQCRKKLQRQNPGLQQADLKTLRKLRDRTDHLRYGEQLLVVKSNSGASQHDAFTQAFNDWDVALAALESTALTTMLVGRLLHRSDMATAAALDMLASWNSARAMALHTRTELTQQVLRVAATGATDA